MWSYFFLTTIIILSVYIGWDLNYDVYWTGQCQIFEDIPDITYEYGLIRGNIPFIRLCDLNNPYYHSKYDVNKQDPNTIQTDWSECISTCSIPTNKTGTIFRNFNIEQYDHNCDSENSCQLYNIQYRYYLLTNISFNEHVNQIIFRQCPIQYKWISTVGECQSDSSNNEASLKWECIIANNETTVASSFCQSCHRNKLISDLKCKDAYVIPNDWTTSNWTTCWGNCVNGHQKQYAQCNITDENRCHYAPKNPLLQPKRECNLALNDLCVHGSPIYRNKWNGIFLLSPHTSLLHALHHNLTSYNNYFKNGNANSKVLFDATTSHQLKMDAIAGKCTILRYCNAKQYRLSQCYSLDSHHCVTNDTEECRVMPLPHFKIYLLSQHCNCNDHLNYNEYPCL